MQVAAASARTHARSGPTPVLIVDESGRCVEVNDEAAALLGLERAQLIGRSVESLRLPPEHLLVLPRRDSATNGTSLPQARPGKAAQTRARRPSRRELEILTHLARGATDNQVAQELQLSPATVQTHVRNAKTKIGARTRAEAVALAIVGGLIELK